MITRSLTSAAAVGLLAMAGLAVTAGAADAQSRERHRSASISGPNHSMSRNADIYRSRGSAQISRYGTIDGQSWSSSRNRTTVDTGNGYATSAIHVGPTGNTQVRNSSVAYGDGSYSRSSGVQTSGGYGYQRDVDAYRTDDGVTVNRSITTNSGDSRSSTVTWPY